MRSSIHLGLILAAVFALSGCDENPRRPKSARPLAPTVGQPAPEIDGEDLDGKYFKLSDYKGKVVLLDFWGMWCGPCRHFLPHGKQLVQMYKDRPFAAVGVNTDEDPDWPRQSRDLAMRCWADGSRHPITTRWGITGFPTLYIIDHEGVIQRVFEGVPADASVIDLAIEQLVKKAERSKS